MADETAGERALRAQIGLARMIVESLRHEVQLARTARDQRGGQHAGTPAFVGIPPSILIRLDRELGQALAAMDAAHVSPPVTESALRAALDERDAIVVAMRAALEPLARMNAIATPRSGLRHGNESEVYRYRRVSGDEDIDVRITAGDVRRAAKLCGR